MYVVEGRAEVVLKNGDHVNIPAGGFIGEQSFITGENTSADVATGREAAKILSWDSDSLRKYLEKKPHLKETLELILTSDVIHKLRDMEEKYDEIKHSNDLNIS
jgi:CRP-like cAMP-binding protein